MGSCIAPRIIIHGGAGKIERDYMPPDKYRAYRAALLSIVASTKTYMQHGGGSGGKNAPRSALDGAAYAVSLLEDHPLFNAGHGAVFTRDGINELEASVMVSRGRAKRAVGVMGLRHVRNPILLAKRILEHGDEDLGGALAEENHYHDDDDDDDDDGDDDDDVTVSGGGGGGDAGGDDRDACKGELDVPSAQGHSQLWGRAAEQLARQYGLALVPREYFFTQHRWDEHIDGLKRRQRRRRHDDDDDDDEKGRGSRRARTGGLTNKLTGRIGDTPTIGAGFWAEEWLVDDDDDDGGGRGGGGLGALLSTTTTTTTAIPWLPSWLCGAAAGRGEGEGGVIGIESVVERCRATGRVVAARADLLMDYNCGGMFRAWIDEQGVPRMSVWNNHGEDDPRHATNMT
ncbi:L-asparaginase precursor [Moelleriella libera RCEF 2490]|uniref:L-asparaginase n=1 Tax=Moelleriella libera RCEF 2490 TaxID=1081109 RepID=A0A168CNV8_9HYPO|nr:L-asparaginase precursor [Moelleriella libera RCEF 2490]